MKWAKLESQVAFTCRQFKVRSESCRAESSGKVHDFHHLELRDWVSVIPLTSANEVVLIRQFRHGIADLSLEIPGGILDPEDPSPGAAALRELREETGYSSAHLELLGILHPNPAIQDNRLHMFVAHHAVLDGPTSWDITEEIAIERVPLSEIDALIGSGQIVNALVVVAFQMLAIHRRRTGDAA